MMNALLYSYYIFFLFFNMRLIVFFFFFFSSRRRHTRFDCDWSSDVCSSDLGRRRNFRWCRRSCFRRAQPAAAYACLVPGNSRAHYPDQSSWSARNLGPTGRSEEHTSELQSQSNLVCRLLLEKKKPVDDLHFP